MLNKILEYRNSLIYITCTDFEKPLCAFYISVDTLIFTTESLFLNHSSILAMKQIHGNPCKSIILFFCFYVLRGSKSASCDKTLISHVILSILVRFGNIYKVIINLIHKLRTIFFLSYHTKEVAHLKF